METQKNMEKDINFVFILYNRRTHFVRMSKSVVMGLLEIDVKYDYFSSLTASYLCLRVSVYLSVCVCVCVKERERVCVLERIYVREWKMERECVNVCMCLCVFVWVSK